jgi:hypothetical protein
MKTQFIITADTDAMKVTLVVKQGGKVMWKQDRESVTQACQTIMNSIGKVMEKRGQA